MKTRIDFQYHEIIGWVILEVMTMSHFGITIKGTAACLFTGILIQLSLIDWKHQCLPNVYTLSLILLGLLMNAWALFVSLREAFLGAILAYVILWCITELFRILSGKVGMGRGDLKLFAAIGAWLGWQPLPWVMAASSLSGFFVMAWMIFFRYRNKDEAMAFGPFLAFFGWSALWLY